MGSLSDAWKEVSDPFVNLYHGVFGDPKGVKAAYDAQIQASKDAQSKLQQFLMGQKGQAQAIYQPLQHMFSAAYGTEGLQAPQIPQAPGGPLSRMYGGK